MSEAQRSPPRQVRLFRNNRSQALRIPVEFELPGDSAVISREGDRLIVEPIRPSTGLLDLIESWDALDEDFPEIADPPVAPERIF